MHVSNSYPSPPFLVADSAAITPLIHDKSYIDFLLGYCRQNSIRAVIPLFDVDLPVLSRNAGKFAEAGVSVIVSSPDVVGICNDKWKTYNFLLKNGIPAPKTYVSLESCVAALKEHEVDFPLFVKPRWGMGSIGVFEASSMAELECMHRYAREQIFASYLKYESAQDADGCVLIQEKLEGEEYGLDIINDLDCNHVATVVKKKIAMRAGETDSAITVASAPLQSMGKKVSLALGHRANLDVDAFLTSEGPAVLEMNARFGGGYPFSHMAGVNLPRQILEWVEGKPTNPKNFEHSIGLAFQKDIVIRPLPM